MYRKQCLCTITRRLYCISYYMYHINTSRQQRGFQILACI